MQEDKHLHIKNHIESMVLDRIRSMGEVLAKGDEFASDVACIALNRIKPRYVRENIYLWFYIKDSEWGAMNRDVAEAVDFAIDYVKTHAIHE